MINSISSTTKSGEKLSVDLFDPYSSGIVVKEITGLGPVKADLGMERYALIDGAFLKGVRVGTRNVVLTLIPYGEDIQFLRRKVYQFFDVGSQIEFGVITDLVSVKSDFYVESVEPTIFAERQEIQVSLIGLDPYWRSQSSSITGLIGFNDTTPSFEFPFSSTEKKDIIFGEMANAAGKDIRYLGDTPTGVIITFSFNATVSNLVVSNATFNETMSISKVGQFYKGEQLVIDTRPRKKSVIHRSHGYESYISGVLSSNSQWIRLHPGLNNISLEFAGGRDDVDVSIQFESLYRGV